VLYYNTILSRRASLARQGGPLRAPVASPTASWGQAPIETILRFIPANTGSVGSTFHKFVRNEK